MFAASELPVAERALGAGFIAHVDTARVVVAGSVSTAAMPYTP